MIRSTCAIPSATISSTFFFARSASSLLTSPPSSSVSTISLASRRCLRIATFPSSPFFLVSLNWASFLYQFLDLPVKIKQCVFYRSAIQEEKRLYGREIFAIVQEVEKIKEMKQEKLQRLEEKQNEIKNLKDENYIPGPIQNKPEQELH